MSETILSPAPRAGRDEKRDSILRVAYAAFLEEGYAATSMSSIAAKVGGSKATLYNYFSSKEELFAAVIAEKCREVDALVFEAESDPADFRTALTHLAERIARLITDDEKIATFRLVTAEAGRFPELGRAFYESGPKQGHAHLAQYFDRAVAEGKLKPRDTGVMADQFFHLCKGELHHKKLWCVAPNPTDAEIRDHVEQAMYVFFAAYGVEKAEPV